MKVEPFADSIFIGPEMLGHGLVGDDHLPCTCSVGVSEFAASDERDAKSLKKSWSYVIHLRQSSAVAGGFIVTLREDRAGKRRNQWRSIGNRSGLHTGGGFGAFDGSAEELLAVAFVVMQGAQIKIEHEEVCGFKAGINALRILHTANEKPGTNERDQSQGNFSHNEHAAERTACPSDRIAAPAHL